MASFCIVPNVLTLNTHQSAWEREMSCKLTDTDSIRVKIRCDSTNIIALDVKFSSSTAKRVDNQNLGTALTGLMPRDCDFSKSLNRISPP
jgi:hypothetical protein